MASCRSGSKGWPTEVNGVTPNFSSTRSSSRWISSTPAVTAAAGSAARRLQGPVEVVEHGQELAQQGLVGVAGVLLALARRALPRVVELGDGAEIAVLLGFHLAGLGLEGLAEPLDLVRRLVGHRAIEDQESSLMADRSIADGCRVIGAPAGVAAS